MNKLSNKITIFLLILIITKGVSFGLLWFLPKKPMTIHSSQNHYVKYRRVDFSGMLEYEKSSSTIATQTTNITEIILKGLYGKDDKGFVIVAMRSNPNKTSIVAVGEDFMGYTLKTIFINKVVFYKDGSEYILQFEKSKDFSTMVTQQPAPMAPKTISREKIKYFSTNPNEIWKNISIQEVKEDGMIKGFRVNKINKESIFSQLGLIKGDLIIKANNVRLSSYRDVFNIYENMDKLDTIQIVVLRNDTEVELVYEIN